MTYRPRAACKRCRTPRGLAGGLSRTGLCLPCSEVVYADAMGQIVARSGPVFRRYRDGITDYAASLWGQDAIPDTLPGEYTQLSLMEVTGQ